MRFCPLRDRIQQKAPPVTLGQCVKFLSGEHQPVRIHGLRDARLNMRVRQIMFAQIRATETKEIVCSRRDATPAIKVIADALRE